MKHFALLIVSSLAIATQSNPAHALDFQVQGDADVIFLGEIHDNPQHHDNQAQVIMAIEPAAIVFEMLGPEQAAKITQDLLDDEAKLEAALQWDASGWPAFSMYYPIFAVSGQAEIYGAQVARGAARAAIEGGDMSAALEGQGALYGLTKPLPDAQQATRETLQMEAHCNALPEEMLPGMVMAQRLRDARLAQVSVQAWAETGGPVVVITGNGHARQDWGAPSLLPEDFVSISLGQLESEPEGEPPYDAWLVTDPAEREDPCAAFK